MTANKNFVHFAHRNSTSVVNQTRILFRRASEHTALIFSKYSARHLYTKNDEIMGLVLFMNKVMVGESD